MVNQFNIIRPGENSAADSQYPMVGFQCPFTDICQNTKCFWKQRDCYNRQVFVWFGPNEPQQTDEEKEICKEYIMPKWTTTVVTNGMSLTCPDYKGKNNG